METQKTTARSILLPLALGTFSFLLTAAVANKLFKTIPQRALVYGGSVGVTTSLVTWGFIGNKKIDPSKFQILEGKKKTEQILQALQICGIFSENMHLLVEQRDWQALSKAVCENLTHSIGQNPPKEHTISLSDGQTFAIYKSFPIHKIIFTEEEFLNFNVEHCGRPQQLYVEVEVDEQSAWIAKGDLTLYSTYKKEELSKPNNTSNGSSSSTVSQVVENPVLTLKSIEFPLTTKQPNHDAVSLKISRDGNTTTYWISEQQALKLIKQVRHPKKSNHYKGASDIRIDKKSKKITAMIHYHKQSNPQELSFDCSNWQVKTSN